MPRIPEMAPLMLGPADVIGLRPDRPARPPEDPVVTKRRAGFKIIDGGRR
jgi:hypothetical protein